MTTEFDFQQKMIKYFEKYFNIYPEVWDVNMTKRIDLVLIHKSDKDKKFPFGIELKKHEKKRGKDVANWLKQASNYNDLDFKTFGKLLILVAPQISINYLREGIEMTNHENKEFEQHNNVNTFLAQFGIGEVMKITRHNNLKNIFEKSLCFVFNSKILYEYCNDDLKIGNLISLWKQK